MIRKLNTLMNKEFQTDLISYQLTFFYTVLLLIFICNLQFLNNVIIKTKV